ncbi:MAG: hypothetical protein Kow0075_14130 [Salibacteraceae bacterium]
MKTYFSVLFVSLIATGFVHGQCTAGIQNPSTVVVADSALFEVDTISMCSFAGHYAQIYLPVGGSYRFSSSIATDYLLIKDQANNTLADGHGELVFGTASADTVLLHLFADTVCTTQSACRTTTVTKLPCTAGQAAAVATDTLIQTPLQVAVSGCINTGKYFDLAVPAGHTYFIQSNSGDVFYFTDTAGNYFDHAASPYTGSVPGTGYVTIRTHLFSDGGCGVDTACRSINVTCLTCLPPAPVIAASDTHYCGGDQPLTLTATDTIDYGSTFWYAGGCGGMPFDSGSNTLVLPTSDTWYYAANVFNGVSSVCDSVFISYSSPPTVSFNNINPAVCFGDSSGNVIAAASGGTSPYQFTWSDGSTGPGLTQVPAGTYTVTVSDAAGCAASASATIIQPMMPLDISILDVKPPACFGEPTGEANLSATGGYPPYQVMWSNGANGELQTNLLAGSYMVTVTDSMGCDDTVTVNISSPGELIVATIVNQPPACHGDTNGMLSVTAFGGTPPYSFHWSDGNTGPSITGLGDGVYAVTVTDQNGCIKLHVETLEEPDAIELAFDSYPTKCPNDFFGSIKVEPSGGTPPYSFSWSVGQVGDSIIGLTAGVYGVSVADNHGCIKTDTVEVESEYPEPLILLPDSAYYCTGYNAELVAGSSGQSYLWSTGDTSRTVYVDSAGIYSVTASNDYGCQKTAQVTVYEDDCLGTHEHDGFQYVRLYPNPTDGVTWLAISGQLVSVQVVVSVSTVSGQVLMRKYVHGQHVISLDLKPLAPGIYFIHVNAAGHRISHKVILTAR